MQLRAPMVYRDPGVPMWPRTYLDTTTIVAICDQNFGISTSFCSKTTRRARW
jgi:hypothetical protein